MLDGLNSQRSGDVRFAGAGPANQYYVVSAVDELAAMEFMLDKMKNTKSNDEFFNSMKRS